MLIDFRERGREGERGRETCMRNINPLPLAHSLTGTKPATRACALTKNRTRDLSVYRMALQPTEPHQPGRVLGFQSKPLPGPQMAAGLGVQAPRLFSSRPRVGMWSPATLGLGLASGLAQGAQASSLPSPFCVLKVPTCRVRQGAPGTWSPVTCLPVDSHL